MKKIFSKQLVLIIIDIILLIVSIIAYNGIYKSERGKIEYTELSTKFIEENQEPVFRIGQIILYSSANAVDNSNGNLKDIDISQFTDIELYIDNKTKGDELTPENTISELYVDKIKVTSDSNDGEKIFNYKNPLMCGKYTELQSHTEGGILFNVVNSNDNNRKANYDEPVFYTDCSNPISFGYINKNILTGCEVTANNGSISFDGSILKNANIDLDELKSSINFTIYLRNNYDEEFVCNVTIDNNLLSDDATTQGIYSGYLMKIIDTKDVKYNFLKVS